MKNVKSTLRPPLLYDVGAAACLHTTLVCLGNRPGVVLIKDVFCAGRIISIPS